MAERRRVRNQRQSKGDDKAVTAAVLEEVEMEIVRGVAGGKKRGRSKRDDNNAAAAAAAEGEETVVEGGKKRGGKKSTAAAVAAPKEDEVPTPKRLKIWGKSIKLTEQFLMKEIGINPSRSKEVVEKLKAQDVVTVGSLLGLSEDKLEKNVGLRMGSVGAIMRFIEEQKGKNEEWTKQNK